MEAIFWLSMYGVHIGATWQIWLNRPCVAAMRPCVKLLWPLVEYFYQLHWFIDFMFLLHFLLCLKLSCFVSLTPELSYDKFQQLLSFMWKCLVNLRREQLSLQYCMKLKSTKLNPTHKTVFQPQTSLYHNKPNAIPSLGVRIQSTIPTINIMKLSVANHQLSPVPLGY